MTTNQLNLKSAGLTELSENEMKAVDGGFLFLLAALIVAAVGVVGYLLGKSDWSD